MTRILITQIVGKIQELTKHPQYERFAKKIKGKTPVSLTDVLAALNNLAAVVNI